MTGRAANSAIIRPLRNMMARCLGEPSGLSSAKRIKQSPSSNSSPDRGQVGVVLCHHDRRLELADYWQHPGPVLFRRERLGHVAQTDGLVDEGLSLKAERALGREVFPEPLLAHPRARFTFLVKFSPRLQPVEPNPVVADKEPPGA